MEGKTSILLGIAILLVFLGASYFSPSITGFQAQEVPPCVDLLNYPKGLILNESFKGEEVILCKDASMDDMEETTYDSVELDGKTYSFTQRTIGISTSDVTLDCNHNVFIGTENVVAILINNPDGEVEGVKVRNCNFRGYGLGFLAKDMFTSIIENSTISGADAGIYLINSTMNTVQSNSIYDSGVGLHLSESGSILINNLLDNVSTGVKIYGGKELSVYGNTFRGTGTALVLKDVESAEVFSNLFSGFSSRAIEASSNGNIQAYYNMFDHTVSDSKLVSISSSNFTWSTYGEECLNSHSDQTNLCVEGNYWSDYDPAKDKDSNGLGDVPFVITTGQEDPAPFINKNFELSELCYSDGTGNLIDDNHDGHIDEGCVVVLALEKDSEEFSLLEGDSIDFTCKESEKHTFKMDKLSPAVVSVSGIRYALADEVTNIDVDGDGISDVSVTFAGIHPKKGTAGILLTRLGPCIYYCGNGACEPGETTADCEIDCLSSSCGNKVCDSGETEENCDADCGFKVNFLLIGILIVVGLAAIIFVYEWKAGAFSKKEPPTEFEEEPIEEEPKPKAPQELKDYAASYLDKGYSATQIKDVLTAEGWGSGEIDLALEELASEGTPTEGTESTASALSDLKAYVSEARKEKSDEEIKEELRQAGWDDAVIDTVLKKKRGAA